MDEWPRGLELPPKAELIICADGGLQHCLSFGLRPDLVVGDMDSASASDLEALSAGDTEIIRHPKRKNETDLELAIMLAQKRGVKRIKLLGALGRRWDMSLSNLLLLAAEPFRELDITVLEAEQEMRCVRGPATVEIPGRVGERLSLLPLGQSAVGVCLEGLEYPLNQDTLTLGTTWGMSNVFSAPLARVSFQEGILMIIKSPPEPEG